MAVFLPEKRIRLASKETSTSAALAKSAVRFLEEHRVSPRGACRHRPHRFAERPPQAPSCRPGDPWGSVLPGIEYKLEPVEGLEQSIVHGPQSAAGAVPSEGRLLVRGPNVMRGYLNPEANVRFRTLGGWYDTGDIVQVDADGFVFILGRLKRFAKISGEMVSLTAVEDALAGAFPQYGLRFAVAVIAKLDAAKGEKLVAVTNEPKLELEEVREAIRARGLPNLAMPREIKVIHEMPAVGQRQDRLSGAGTNGLNCRVQVAPLTAHSHHCEHVRATGTANLRR